MFQPSYFKQSDIKQMLAFIREYSMASIVTLSANGLVANHIPMLVVKRGDGYVLQGHVARVNSICADSDDSVDALALFHGPNAYISPSWYPSKKKDPRTVPTWNYVVVHVNGAMSFYDDKTWLKEHLRNLSDTHEKKVGANWKLSDAPDDYIDKMLKAIVGVEIEVKSISGNTKMSQNHPPENRDGVIEGLNALGQEHASSWVQNPNGD
ncbi:MAG: FMN-binding negative transcriptional regulator [Proteobacteria bacterium]|nr:FMN-binding negative transcriptional regulator [Pseudomonadota bacterium]